MELATQLGMGVGGGDISADNKQINMYQPLTAVIDI